MFNGQSEQDKFVMNILKHKQNGFFVEIGSNHPININNSYLLETSYNWKGIMVENDPEFLPSYIEHRPNSIHVIQDATTIDYKELFQMKDVAGISTHSKCRKPKPVRVKSALYSRKFC